MPDTLLAANLELCSQNESFAVVNDGIGIELAEVYSLHIASMKEWLSQRLCWKVQADRWGVLDAWAA
jgi:hypothetical protein